MNILTLRDNFHGENKKWKGQMSKTESWAHLIIKPEAVFLIHHEKVNLCFPHALNGKNVILFNTHVKYRS